MKTFFYIFQILLKFVGLVVLIGLYIVLGVIIGIIVTKLHLWYVIIPILLYYGIKKFVDSYGYYKERRRKLNETVT